MLAKDYKKITMQTQREFIEKKLDDALSSENGNTAVVYTGCLYNEVIEYFQQNGHDVRLIKSDALIAKNNGMPSYLIQVDERYAALEPTELRRADEKIYRTKTDVALDTNAIR